MIEFLLMAVIVIFIVLIGVIIFLWIQFNSTDSRLMRIIMARFRLFMVTSDTTEIEEETDSN